MRERQIETDRETERERQRERKKTTLALNSVFLTGPQSSNYYVMNRWRCVFFNSYI